MRGDVVFRIYGVHEGRAEDYFFDAFRSRAEADAEIAKLAAKDMHGSNWAARYHNRGFVIREHVVETDFEIPPLPKPRDKYFVETVKTNPPGTWDSTRVEVFRRRGTSDRERVGGYVRNYGMLQTFEPFRQGTRELALISRDYTKTAVMDLASGDIVAEETEATPGGGFCPVGFYVPDWWDVNDGSIIPGHAYWDADNEWAAGAFGFVWGCFWGDDTSWKVQYLDLRRVQEGVIARDERFGYVRLATAGYSSPCLRSSPGEGPSHPPPFIAVEKSGGRVSLVFAVELGFDLESGKVDEHQYASLLSGEHPEA